MDGGSSSERESTVMVIGPHSRVLAFGPLVVTEVFGLMSQKEVDAAMDAVSRVGEMWGEVSQIVLFDAAEILRIPRLSKERARAALRAFQGFVRGAALVVTGTGLGPSCFRVQLEKDNAFLHLGPRQRVFDALGPAMQWLGALEGQPIPVRTLSWLKIAAALRALPSRPSPVSLARVA